MVATGGVSRQVQRVLEQKDAPVEALTFLGDFRDVLVSNASLATAVQSGRVRSYQSFLAAVRGARDSALALVQNASRLSTQAVEARDTLRSAHAQSIDVISEAEALRRRADHADQRAEQLTAFLNQHSLAPATLEALREGPIDENFFTTLHAVTEAAQLCSSGVTTTAVDGTDGGDFASPKSPGASSTMNSISTATTKKTGTTFTGDGALASAIEEHAAGARRRLRAWLAGRTPSDDPDLITKATRELCRGEQTRIAPVASTSASTSTTTTTPSTPSTTSSPLMGLSAAVETLVSHRRVACEARFSAALRGVPVYTPSNPLTPHAAPDHVAYPEAADEEPVAIIEPLAGDPRRYVGDVLAWIHQAVAQEGELFGAICSGAVWEERGRGGNKGRQKGEEEGQEQELEQEQEQEPEENDEPRVEGSGATTGSYLPARSHFLDEVTVGWCDILRHRVDGALHSPLTGPRECLALLPVIAVYTRTLRQAVGASSALVGALVAAREATRARLLELMTSVGRELEEDPPALPPLHHPVVPPALLRVAATVMEVALEMPERPGRATTTRKAGGGPPPTAPAPRGAGAGPSGVVDQHEDYTITLDAFEAAAGAALRPALATATRLAEAARAAVLAQGRVNVGMGTGTRPGTTSTEAGGGVTVGATSESVTQRQADVAAATLGLNCTSGLAAELRGSTLRPPSCLTNWVARIEAAAETQAEVLIELEAEAILDVCALRVVEGRMRAHLAEGGGPDYDDNHSRSLSQGPGAMARDPVLEAGKVSGALRALFQRVAVPGALPEFPNIRDPVLNGRMQQRALLRLVKAYRLVRGCLADGACGYRGDGGDAAAPSEEDFAAVLGVDTAYLDVQAREREQLQRRAEEMGCGSKSSR